MKPLVCKVISLIFASLAFGVQAQVVIQDGDVTVEREELQRIIKRWPDNMRTSAANSEADRLELLNLSLVTKKMALEAEKLTPEADGDTYWNYHFALQGMQREFIFDKYMANLQVPDMSALAEERYLTEKDRYALVEEQRMSSHILLSCPPGCDRKPFRLKADELVVQLDNGADFDELVAAHSNDPQTKHSGGKLDRWMTFGEAGITPNYLAALFEIPEVGGHSLPVDTEFGLHIIRLDEVRESYYKPFDEVRAEIVQSLESEFRQLAAKDYTASFRVTDDLRIDGEVLEELLQDYKTE